MVDVRTRRMQRENLQSHDIRWISRTCALGLRRWHAPLAILPLDPNHRTPNPKYRIILFIQRLCKQNRQSPQHLQSLRTVISHIPLLLLMQPLLHQVLSSHDPFYENVYMSGTYTRAWMSTYSTHLLLVHRLTNSGIRSSSCSSNMARSPSSTFSSTRAAR